MARFDEFAREEESTPQTNGHSNLVKQESPIHAPIKDSPVPKANHKRKSVSQHDDDSSPALPAIPPPKKKRKAEPLDPDAVFAAKLQAEEDRLRGRATRGGSGRKVAPLKKKKPATKKKSSDKVKTEDDSDLEGSGSAAEKKVNRSGAFHVSGHRPIWQSQPQTDPFRNRSSCPHHSLRS